MSAPHDNSPAPDLSLVVACFDEEEALPRLFGEIDRLDRLAAGRGLAAEYLLVNDGSRDRTAALLAGWSGGEPRRRVLTHEENRGFGAAMRTGFGAARGRAIVCYDADATYPIEDVLVLVDALSGADVAGASPFADGGEVSAGPVRSALSRGVAGLYRLAVRRDARLTAYTCAFRAYRSEVLRGAVWRADDFLAAAELLSVLLIAGARVREVPSRLTKRIHGRSKMKVARTALRHLVLLAGISSRRGRFRDKAPRRSRPAAEIRDPSKTESLTAWNRTLNRDWPMSRIESHPNPLVRGVEERRRREVVRLAGPLHGRRALDVGAEEGAYAARLSGRGARPLALDIDRRVLSRCRAVNGVECVAGDAHRLPFADASFPRVLLAEVLEHCPDPGAAISEALRVTSPAGRVAISIPDDRVILAAKRLLMRLRLARFYRGLPSDLAPGHLHVFSREALRRLIGRRGRLITLRRDPLALAFLAAVAPGDPV